MNVVITVVLLAVVGVLWFAVYNRLIKLRKRVKDSWKALETRQDDQTLRDSYNAHVKTYNEVLETFPANMVALVSGFKPARIYESSTGSTGSI